MYAFGHVQLSPTQVSNLILVYLGISLNSPMDIFLYWLEFPFLTKPQSNEDHSFRYRTVWWENWLRIFGNIQSTLMQLLFLFDQAMRVESSLSLMQTLASQLSSTPILILQGLNQSFYLPKRPFLNWTIPGQTGDFLKNEAVLYSATTYGDRTLQFIHESTWRIGSSQI